MSLLPTAPAHAVAALVAGRRTWLLDLDGTLIDSGPVHEAAFRAAITEFAPELLGSFRYASHSGATTRDVVARLGVPAGTADRLVRRKQQLYRAEVDAGRVGLRPGARRLLGHLNRYGHGAYLVTNGSRRSVERVLDTCGLRRWLRGVVTGDDVDAGKPDPAIYHAACHRWAVDPSDAVAVEDSADGVASAVAAGLVTLQVQVAVPAPGAVPVAGLDTVASLVEQAGGHA